MFNKNKKNITVKNYQIEPKFRLKENQILYVKNLKVFFKNKLGHVQAVRGIDLSLNKGQIIGLVGESGSGKSVSVKTIIGFNEGGIIDAECINLNGINLKTLTKNQWPNLRGTTVGYIPQDPLMALDPTKKIKYQIIDAIKMTQYRKLMTAIFSIKQKYDFLKKEDSTKDYTKICEAEIKAAKDIYNQNTTKEFMYQKMIDVLHFIGIKNPEKNINSYPHEFSGGMRQRIVIAIVIVGQPDLIIADEPTTALDVTIQAKVIDLIKKLKDKLNISIIFISHNIALVANLCDYIYIMYAGKIVEKGLTEEIFLDPKHPYTWALIGSIPDTNSNKQIQSIPGTPPNMLSPPKGDAFAARNVYAKKIDFEQEPSFFKVSNTHYAATWLLHPDCPPEPLPLEVKEKILVAAKSLKIKTSLSVPKNKKTNQNKKQKSKRKVG